MRSRENMAHCMPYAGYGYGDEDSIEPVYFKLENLQSDCRPNSDPDQDVESEPEYESSVEEEDVELDLFAPPHDS